MTKLKPLRFVRIAFASALVALISSLASGQVKTPKLGDLPTDFTTLQKPPASQTAIALEGAVNPATYVIGPGDRLEFDVWGAIEERHELIVAPDGSIAVPGVGSRTVAGMTVTAADSLIRHEARKSYQRATVMLRLIGVRLMKASVSGAVQYPGVYEVSSVDRVTALLEKAGGPLLTGSEVLTTQKPQDQPFGNLTPAEQRRAREKAEAEEMARPIASLRHLTITARDGSSKSVDLQRFRATGDVAFNPVLQDGDEVHVPILTRETGVVTVFGAVKSPGEFEYRDGDRLMHLIQLAGGFREDALTEDIAIVRFAGDGFTQSEIRINLSRGDPEGPPLQSDDRIFVRKKPDYRAKFQVTVKGEVKFPGSYPIEEDKTKLSEIIEECGGPTDHANIVSARVLRRSLEKAEDPEFERLKGIPVAEMNEMEYEYFKIRSREEAPPVVVNFHKLLIEGDESQDITLQDKDEIEIPTLSPTVKVAGQVNKPGLIRYVPGEDYYYYVQKAGGYSWNSRKGKLRLIKAQSGTWMKPKKSTPIEIGDTIFVPEKQEVDWWEITKDLLLVASQVATVLIMVRSL